MLGMHFSKIITYNSDQFVREALLENFLYMLYSKLNATLRFKLGNLIYFAKDFQYLQKL